MITPSQRDNPDADEADESERNQNIDNSSESAGLARGAIRTATSVSKRSAVGRLPVSANSTAARVLPRRLRAQRVARVSDRLSTGFDAVDAASSTIDTQSSSTTIQDGTTKSEGPLKNKRWDLMKEYTRKGFIFTGNLVKYTVLGAAVFESYEQIVIWMESNNSPYSVTERYNDDGRLTSTYQNPLIKGESDVCIRTSIPQHIIAGACAGTVHSVLSLTVQSLQSFHASANTGTRYSSFLPRNITQYTAHHATAHAILFGTYECSKRILLPIVGKSSLIIESERPEHSNLFYGEMTAVGIAGGIAGQAQHIVSHFTEILCGIDGKCETKVKGFQNNFWPRLRKMVWTMPSFRSILVAFPPSAIGFVAYEYGKELVSFQ